MVGRLLGLFSEKDARFEGLAAEDIKPYFSLTRKAEAPPAVVVGERDFIEPELVPVPAGPFLMGSTEEQVAAAGGGFGKETPQHTVDLPEKFAMGKYPVTNLEYQLFVRGAVKSLGADCIEKDMRAKQIEDDEIAALELDLGVTRDGVLVVSQFTLYGDVRSGRRPSFVGAAPPGLAEPLYERFCAAVAAEGVGHVARGRFGASMAVSLVNQGPVTLIVDTPGAETA